MSNILPNSDATRAAPAPRAVITSTPNSGAPGVDRTTAHMRTVLFNKFLELARLTHQLDETGWREANTLLFIADARPWAWDAGEVRDLLDDSRDEATDGTLAALLRAVADLLESLPTVTVAGRASIASSLAEATARLRACEPELSPESEAALGAAFEPATS